MSRLTKISLFAIALTSIPAVAEDAPEIAIRGGGSTYTQYEDGVLTETGDGFHGGVEVLLVEEALADQDLPRAHRGHLAAHVDGGLAFSDHPEHPLRPIGDLGADLEAYFSPKSDLYLALGGDVIDLDPTRDRFSMLLATGSPFGGFGVGAKSRTGQAEILWTPSQLVHERNSGNRLVSTAAGTEINLRKPVGNLGEVTLQSQVLYIDHQLDSDNDRVPVSGYVVNLEAAERIPFVFAHGTRGNLALGASLEHAQTDRGVNRTTVSGDLQVTAAF